jgi:hypothetical protein
VRTLRNPPGYCKMLLFRLAYAIEKSCLAMSVVV